MFSRKRTPKSKNRRQRNAHSMVKSSYGRRLRAEQLEDRRLLATLTAGDVAIIGVRADDIDGTTGNGNDDAFAWVPLADMDAGDQVFFTDAGWTAGGTFRPQEGAISYTAPVGGLSAGTVMLLEFSRTSTGGVYTFTPTGGGGTYGDADDANVGLTGVLPATPGDNFFVFTGSSAAPNFLWGWKNDGPYDADATSNSTTALPAGLTEGVNAMTVELSEDGSDNNRYTGTTTGTAAELATAIANPANWEISNLPLSGGNDITNGTSGSSFTVTPGNMAPTITSSDFANISENTTFVLKVTATDDMDREGFGFTFSITGGADQALFDINSVNGNLTFKTKPDHENPDDVGEDNNYEVQVAVTDSGGLSDMQDVTVTVTDSFEHTWHLENVAFNTGAIGSGSFDYDATNGTYSNFNITISNSPGNGTTNYGLVNPASGGSATFMSTVEAVQPDMTGVNVFSLIFAEALTDLGGNVDIMQIALSSQANCNASCGGIAGPVDFVQSGRVTTEVLSAPTITSTGSVDVEENQTAVIDVMAVDTSDAEGNGLVFSKTGGADELLFNLDANTGVLTFINPPDFDAPGDAGADNVYNVQVTVSDFGGLSDVQDLTITVTGINEPPIFTSSDMTNVVENSTSAITLLAEDEDIPAQAVSYRLLGQAPAGELGSGLSLEIGQTINSPDGSHVLVMQGDGNLVVYESGVPRWATGTNGTAAVRATVLPNGNLQLTDSGGGVIYQTNSGSDAGSFARLRLTNGGSPEIVRVDGARLWAGTVGQFADLGIVSNPDPLAPEFTKAADTDLFQISGGNQLQFLAAPNFELPGDVNADNVYEVSVLADDGNGGVSPQTVQVTVTDIFEQIVVDLTNDENDGDFSQGNLSLREAILFANAQTGADAITFDGAVFGSQQSISLGSQLPTITDAVTITGTGAQMLTLNAGNGTDNSFGSGDGFRHFHIDDGDAQTDQLVVISGMTLTGGDAPKGAEGDDSGPTGGPGGDGESGGAIWNAEDLTITDATISNNTAGSGGNGAGGIDGGAGGNGGHGGAIYSTGPMTIMRSTLRGNRAGLGGSGGGAADAGGNAGHGGHGGAVYILASLSLIESTIGGNSAGSAGNGGQSGASDGSKLGGIGGSGGAIYAAGVTNVSRSTLDSNNAGRGGDGGNSSSPSDGGTGGAGGAIRSTAPLNVDNSTLSGNSAGAGGDGGRGFFGFTTGGRGGNGGAGGGISSTGGSNVQHSTIYQNASGVGGVGGQGVGGAQNGSDGFTGAGGGISSDGLTFANTIVARSTVGADVAVTGLVGSAFNLVEDGSFTSSDTLNVNPDLDSLQPNGGPTQTHALLLGSPAANAGDPSIVFNPSEFDQRGTGFPRVQGPQIDIGAYEAFFQPPDIIGLPTDISVIQAVASPVDLMNPSVVGGMGNQLTITFDAITGTLAATSGNGVTVTGSGTSQITLVGFENALHTYLQTASNVTYTSEPTASGDNADAIGVSIDDGNLFSPIYTVNVDVVVPTGDFDNDGDNDGADFLAWQLGFGIASGAIRSDGDSDSDGDVDADDLNTWESTYGQPVAPLSAIEQDRTAPSNGALLSDAAMALYAADGVSSQPAATLFEEVINYEQVDARSKTVNLGSSNSALASAASSSDLPEDKKEERSSGWLSNELLDRVFG